TDGPQERHMQFAVHAAGYQHWARVENAEDFRRFAVGEVGEVENVSHAINRGRDALSVKRVNHICIRPLRHVGNPHHFHLPRRYTRSVKICEPLAGYSPSDVNPALTSAVVCANMNGIPLRSALAT